MKAKDLMIGDWVYLVKDYGRVKKDILKLDILELYRVSDGMLEVEPMPLTPEILEKNGWQNDEGCFLVDDANIYLNTSCAYLYASDTGNESVLFPVRYVHEFQHVLRLLGFKREIEL